MANQHTVSRGKVLTYSLLALSILLVVNHFLKTNKTAKSQSTPLAAAQPESDVPMHYAKRLQIDDFGTYKRLTIKRPWRGSTTDYTYILYPRGSKKPAKGDADAVIPIPLERVVLTSTTSAPYFVKLGVVDAIAAVTNPELVNTPEVAARIKDGRIKSVGGTNGTSTDFDVEALISLKPDLVIAHSSGSSSHDVFPQIERVGIPVVFNASYMEESPLGRTEWIRFYAALFNKDNEADALFKSIESEYNRLKTLTQPTKERPKVLCNIAYKGTWYVPGGGSYMAKYLEDAGAEYPWADDTSSGGVPTDLEVIIARAKDADIWLNPGLCRSLQAVKTVDSRYQEFEALQTGNVYNHTKKLNKSGGMDYWESGSANPHLVLKDLIAIFHPDLLPDHQSIWYQKLPETLDGSN